MLQRCEAKLCQPVGAVQLVWHRLRSTAPANRPPLPCQPPLPQALLAAAPTLPGLQHVQRWVLAGHSMGARVAASLAGEQPPAAPMAACLLLSYPLHPPRKPAELRDGLLHQLRLPTLLVRGSKDPFSTQPQWDAALQGMHAACAWRQHTVEGGDHGLKVGGPNGAAHTAAALHSVCAAVQQFVREAEQAAEQQQAQGQQASEQQQQQQQQQQGAQGSGRGRPNRGQAAARAPAGRKRSKASPADGKRSRAPAATKAAGDPEKKGGKRARRV